MTPEQLDSVLRTLNSKAEKDGWQVLPEGAMMTLHIAKDGASIAFSRVDAVKLEPKLLLARTAKRELYAALPEDVLAIAFDPGSSVPVRRAGF